MIKRGYHKSIKAMKKSVFKAWYERTFPEDKKDWESQYDSMHPKESPEASK